jgi:hypothetical protein
MKTIKTTIAIFIVSIFAISCSKDDSTPTPTAKPVYETEDFYDGFISKAGLISTFQITGNPDFYEAGLVFKPLVSGKITHYKINIPTIQTTTLVTLWDKATKTVINTSNCGTIGITKESVFDIADIVLEKNKEYVISMNSKNFINKAGVGNIAYPITSGNIQVLDYVTNLGNTKTFPETSTNNESVNGKVSFEFIRTE